MNFVPLDKKVQLKPYIQRPFKTYELMTDDEILNSTGGTLFVDTETYTNYHLIAFKDIKTQKIIKFELDHTFNPRKLAWILQSYRTVGFNSLPYDMPLIWLAQSGSTLDQINEASREIIYNNTRPRDIAKAYNFIIFPTNHIDLIQVCPLRGSLKLYGARLHAKRIQDLPFNVFQPLKEWQKPIVIDYCVNDLDTTELIFNNLQEQLQLRENLSREYRQDVMSKSDAQIAETVISIELKRLTGNWPQRPKIEQLQFNFEVPQNIFFQTEHMQNVLKKISEAEFGLDEYGRLERSNEIKSLVIPIGTSVYRMGIGGLHSSEECTSYKSNNEYQIYDRDVASFYPEIVRKLKLYPQHLGEVFLTIYDGLVERRLSAKEAKRIAESENLKVTINGTFGKTGSPYSVIYAPQMTIQITVGGQLYLLMLIEALELRRIKVISANTDGIVIYCHRNQTMIMNEVIKWWEQVTHFKTEETQYSAIYSRDVNAYLAVGKDGKVKGKNTFYDPWRSQSAKDAYWRFQKNPGAQICVEAVEKLITKNVPIKETIESNRDITKFVVVKNVKGGAHKDGNYLGKVIRWYYAINVFGTINYIESNNKVPDSDGGKPAMDLPDTFPTDINYEWYINKAKELLYDLDYYQRPRQIKFF